MAISTLLQRLKTRCMTFMDKQGFPITLTVCIGVITATALWARQQHTPYIAPTPPPSGEVSAAQLLQESLRSRTSPTPSPTEAPSAWLAPLADTVVLRPFSTESMVRSDLTGVWHVHDGVDLAAPAGTAIRAMADGIVTAAGQDKLQGAWLLIDHNEGFAALYAGMALCNGYIEGDKVFGGDTIGYCGAGPMEESDIGPHLHLHVEKNGVAIDPVTLWSH